MLGFITVSPHKAPPGDSPSPSVAVPSPATVLLTGVPPERLEVHLSSSAVSPLGQKRTRRMEEVRVRESKDHRGGGGGGDGDGERTGRWRAEEVIAGNRAVLEALRELVTYPVLYAREARVLGLNVLSPIPSSLRPYYHQMHLLVNSNPFFLNNLCIGAVSQRIAAPRPLWHWKGTAFTVLMSSIRCNLWPMRLLRLGPCRVCIYLAVDFATGITICKS